MVTSREQPSGGRSGKPSRRKRKPILVEVDGQQFVVPSEYEAEELVSAAEKAAEELAQKQAAEVIAKREKKARKGELNTSPIRLDSPQISVSPLSDGTIDQEWLRDVEERMSRISEAYQRVAQKFETALLIRHQEELDEEDALVALLLTI